MTRIEKIAARIRAIEETTTVNHADIAAVASQTVRGHQAQVMGDAISKTSPGFGKRGNPNARPVSADQVGTRIPQLENEKLEITYQALSAAEERVSKVSNGLTKFMVFGPMSLMLIGPILGILVLIVVIIGVPGALLLGLGLGSYLWQKYFEQKKTN